MAEYSNPDLKYSSATLGRLKVGEAFIIILLIFFFGASMMASTQNNFDVRIILCCVIGAILTVGCLTIVVRNRKLAPNYKLEMYFNVAGVLLTTLIGGLLAWKIVEMKQRGQDWLGFDIIFPASYVVLVALMFIYDILILTGHAANMYVVYRKQYIHFNAPAGDVTVPIVL